MSIEKLLKRTGQLPEKCFSETMSASYTTIAANRDENINEHWDFKCLIKGEWVKFDVKGMKKFDQADYQYDDSIHWIEKQNVRGDRGWLYGDADYIVFDTMTHWLFVKTEKLKNYVECLNIPDEIVAVKEKYRWFKRVESDRDDVIVVVNTQDLRDLAEFEVSHEPYIRKPE